MAEQSSISPRVSGSTLRSFWPHVDVYLDKILKLGSVKYCISLIVDLNTANVFDTDECLSLAPRTAWSGPDR